MHIKKNNLTFTFSLQDSELLITTQEKDPVVLAALMKT